MNRSCFFTLFFFSLVLDGSGQGPGSAKQKISLLFIGDIMGHDEQIWSAENRETHAYDYNEVFSYISPVLKEADIAIANFEVTMGGQPYGGYPKFSSPPALALACRNAGIDYLVTANNHSADRGKEGIEGTINRLDSLGISHTGTFLNQASRDSLQPLIIRKKNFSIALMNYTYGTNDIRVPWPVIVNTLDKEQVTRDIEKAGSMNPDFIILFIHWGTEYDTIPSKSQTDMAKYFFSRGVDLIIGSHPHVLQKMVWFKNDTLLQNKAIVYSLGNFVTNQRKPKTDGGSMVRVELVKTGDSVKITNLGYYLTWVYTPIVKYRKKFYILPCSQFENKPGFFNNPADFSLMKTFITNSRNLLNKQNVNVSEIIFNHNDWLLNNK